MGFPRSRPGRIWENGDICQRAGLGCMVLRAAQELRGWILPGSMRAAAEAYARHAMPSFFGTWGREIVARLAPKPGSRVLDVGCGAGAALLPAAARVGSSGVVLGIDASPVMLEIARRRVEARGLRQVALREADAHALPVEDATFEFVSCPHGLPFFDDAPQAVREMVRSLRPGGRLVATAWGDAGSVPHERAVAEAFAVTFGTRVPFFDRLFVLGEGDALASLAQEAGVEGRVERVERVAHFCDGDALWQALVEGRPVAALAAGLSPHERADLRREVIRRMRPYRCGRGYRSPMQAVVLTVEKQGAS